MRDSHETPAVAGPPTRTPVGSPAPPDDTVQHQQAPLKAELEKELALPGSTLGQDPSGKAAISSLAGQSISF